MIENFGRYQLIERIALGGFAEIFKAHAVGIAGFEKTLAIKRLHPRYSQDSDFIAWMVDEAKITSQLSHTNICQVLDFAKIDGHYFMAMEYITGRDVYRVMKKLRETKTPIPIEMVAFIGREAAAGLDYTHRKRDGNGQSLDIVHRDMSPQNVMVSLDGDVKIIDFGIAKSRARAYETEAGIIKGKFFYMSPEQARGEDLDARTDIFSLGIVLWELVTGELLYKDDDEVTLLSQVRRAVIAPPNTIRADIPDRLNKIIMKALSKERSGRYQSAFELQKDLERFLVRHNAKYGKSQVGYWMRSTFYDELPQKEIENIDSFKHRADFAADEFSLIGAPIEGYDTTRPQLENESDVMELGSDMVQVVDGSESSVIISPIVNDHDDFYEDVPTAAVDVTSQPETPDPASTPRKAASPRAAVQPLLPNEQASAGVDVRKHPNDQQHASVAPWEQKATFEYSPTEVGEIAPRTPTPSRPLRGDLHKKGTLSPLVSALGSGLLERFKTERFYVGLLLLLIMGGAIALTTHLKRGRDNTEVGVTSVIDAETRAGNTSEDCQAYVLKDGKRVCADANMATKATESRVLISTNPSGATVFVNGERHSNKTPTSVRGFPNEQLRITLSLDDYETVNETLRLPKDGRAISLERTLEKPLGTLVISSNPSGASITVEGQYFGETPNTVTLRLDRAHVLRVEKSGYQQQERVIRWRSTDRSIERNLQFDLVRKKRSRQRVTRKPQTRSKKRRRVSKPKSRKQPRSTQREPERSVRSAPLRKGRLRVQTRPWSKVFLDGRSLGDAPVERSINEGRYRLKVCFEGDTTRCTTRRIRIDGNRETTERFRE